MSNTTSDRPYAARNFAVLAGTLLGSGIALAIHGTRVPHGAAARSAFALIYMIVGAVLSLGGGVLAIASVTMSRAEPIERLGGWAIMSALLGFGTCWVCLLLAPPLY
ncbi:MAG: hypothetical protein ABI321_10880 [Polyangia bacterium]